MTSILDARATLRKDLDSVLRSIEATASPDGKTSVRGTMNFGASLVGPKERLHGGLHAFTRTLAVLQAIPQHDSARTFPIRLELGLYRPLPLGVDVGFEGSYQSDDAGFELITEFTENQKLHARATPTTDTEGELAWFRDALARTSSETKIFTIPAQRDIPMDVHPELIVAPVGRTMRVEGSPSFSVFAHQDGALDPAGVCVILDLLGAVTQGYAWKSRIFTTRMDLVITQPGVPADAELVAISSRAAEPDPLCHVRPAETPNGVQGPTKVRVLLADNDLQRVYAHGTITLVPAPGELPKHAR